MPLIKFVSNSTLLSLALVVSVVVSGISSCISQNNKTEQTTLNTSEKTEMKIRKEPFGTAPNGEEVVLYTLSNDNGVKVKITNYGGIVTSIVTPDKDGNMGDVALGFDELAGYIPNDPYFGAIIGRYANRIANGKFTLNGKEYTLATNNGQNHLHGGITGFDKVVWQADELPEQNALKLTYLSEDMEEGYPGNLHVTVTYTLTSADELKIDYEATTDKATPVNITNHSYFNLSAGQDKDILNHIVTINADKYTLTDDTQIPTGELALVKGTPYDFTTPHRVGNRINDLQGYGYDYNYVINNGGEKLSYAATVYDPATGRVMEVFTTQPGIQFYTGYNLDGTLTGKNAQKYIRYAGLCLEAQHFPDSPNQPGFPSSVLKPGEKYRETTVYKFSTRGSE